MAKTPGNQSWDPSWADGPPMTPGVNATPAAKPLPAPKLTTWPTPSPGQPGNIDRRPNGLKGNG